MDTMLKKAQDLKDWTIAIRRDLHEHPELGFQEVRTSGIVARELKELGYHTRENVGITGVLGILTGDASGPTVMLRFDMDALPILEETGASYASQNSGVMHACGHDGHVSIGLTVARLLKAQQSSLRGTVKLVFQPAEEGLGGAAAMISDGALENPRPAAAIGMHLWNERPFGWAGVTAGPFMAGADMFRVKITGKGGHGAMPDKTIDALLAGTQVVSVLQSVVSRNVSPFDFAVVSVTKFQAGTSYNIIPGEAELLGTVRFFMPEVRASIQARMGDIVSSISAGMGCKGEIEFTETTPPVVNDGQVASVVRNAVKKTMSDIQIDSAYRTPVSEDMALFIQQVPGCYFFLGSGVSDVDKRFGHHHPKFDIDEQALPVGAAIMAQAAVDLIDILRNNPATGQQMST